MADNTKIEWTDATWNPIRARNLATKGVGHYCAHVSEGCRNCYAERMQPRFRNPIRFAAQDRDKVRIVLDETVLTQPLRWRRGRKIFPCSMTDLFGDWVTDEMLDRIFAVMALTPQHIYQIVTKRPERMRAWMTEKWQPAKAHTVELCGRDGIAFAAETQGEDRHDQVLRECEHFLNEFKLSDTENDALWTEDGSLKCLQFKWPLPNVWLGFSAEDEPNFDARWDDVKPLADVGWLTWCSVEPMLGPIYISRALSDGLKWIVAGGESGPNARPARAYWFRSLRHQCQAAGVAFFHKQNGEWIDVDTWLDIVQAGSGTIIKSIDRAAPWEPNRPLNYEDAAILAKVTGNRRLHRFDDGAIMIRIDKINAGRQLDGRTWDEFPS